MQVINPEFSSDLLLSVLNLLQNFINACTRKRRKKKWSFKNYKGKNLKKSWKNVLSPQISIKKRESSEKMQEVLDLRQSKPHWSKTRVKLRVEIREQILIRDRYLRIHKGSKVTTLIGCMKMEGLKKKEE